MQNSMQPKVEIVNKGEIVMKNNNGEMQSKIKKDRPYIDVNSYGELGGAFGGGGGIGGLDRDDSSHLHSDNNQIVIILQIYSGKSQ